MLYAPAESMEKSGKISGSSYYPLSFLAKSWQETQEIHDFAKMLKFSVIFQHIYKTNNSPSTIWLLEHIREKPPNLLVHKNLN